MSRINTNVSALIARHNLSRTQNDLSLSLRRLSTGLQINRGADNPSGLIASEQLRSEIQTIGQSIDNIERASNVIATAEAALTEVSQLLVSIKGLIIEAANTGAVTKEEIDANQLQIDSAVESITRIAETTSFAGLKLLNGGLDYIVSGVNDALVSDVSIHGANFGTADTIPVSVEVIASAESAQLFLSGNTAGAPGALLSSVTFEINGPKGTQVFSFASGTALSAVSFAINRVSDSTGVSAYLVDPADPTSGLIINSIELGSDAFVGVRKIEGGEFFAAFDQQGGSEILRDAGEDVLALINGTLALGDGQNVSLRSATMNLELTLTRTAAQTLQNTSFTIVGGGGEFQIGPSVNSAHRVGMGIRSVAATRLGNAETGYLNSITSGGGNSLIAGQQREASDIVDKAIDQIATLRGRLGAFERNTLDTTARSQQIALENLTASESRIRDTDFAEETAKLTRAQILSSAGTSVLALANNSAQNVLSLLGG
jgi:flagellin